jgi:hypothetical protein
MSASAYEPGIWHGPGIAPPLQGVQTERGAELHRRRRWLPHPASVEGVADSQPERGLRIVNSPGVIFKDDDSIKARMSRAPAQRSQTRRRRRPNLRRWVCILSLLLFAISSRDCHQSRGSSGLSSVEGILARTQTERVMKIYDLPSFSSTLDFLTMLALSTGRLLKVRLSPSLLQNSKISFLYVGWHPQHPLCGASCPHRPKPPKNAVILRRPSCTPRIYPRQSPVVAGKLHQAPRRRQGTDCECTRRAIRTGMPVR